MSTFTCTANDLANAHGTGATTWYRDEKCVQGSPSSSGNPRVGVMMFNKLRSSVAWEDMLVNEVRLTLKFGSLGKLQSKTINFYASSRNSVGGYGGDMRGTNLGQVSTSGNARSRTETLTFNGSTNAAVFAKLADWITTGSTYGLAMYLNEWGTSSTSSNNYLNVTEATIAIDYEVRGSTGTLDPAVVDVKGDITLTVTPITSENVVTHRVTYSLGALTSTEYTLAGGVTTHTFTVPAAWLAGLSGVTEAQAVCTLVTYDGETQRGTREIPFTVKVPESYAPVIDSFSVQRYASRTGDQGQTIYEASLSGNHVWVNISASVDRDGGDNAATAQIVYYKEGDESNATTVSITWPNSDNMVKTSDRTVITAEIPLTDPYVFVLTVTNGHTSQSMTGRVELAWAPLHIAGSGYGVGVGCYSDGSSAAKKFECAWPMYYKQCGYVAVPDNENVPAGQTWHKDITFPLPFAEVPVVIVGFWTDSTNGNFGKCCAAVFRGNDDQGNPTLTETGFRLIVYNGDSSPRQPGMAWMAFGRIE